MDDNIITRGAKLDDTMERLTNWNIIMKSIKIFYRVNCVTNVSRLLLRQQCSELVAVPLHVNG